MDKQSQKDLSTSSLSNLGGAPISFSDILLVLAKQIKLIIIIPTILCSFTIVYALFFTTPIYESTSKIMSSSGGGASQASGIAAQFGITLPNDQSQKQWVYQEIIKSRTLARSMLKRKFDTIKYGPQKSLLQILTYGNEEPNAEIKKLESIAVDIFISMVNVSENIQTNIFTITLSASEPKFVSDLNSALLEELDAHQREYNKNKTSKARQFIEERISQTKKELQVSEEDLKDFRTRNRRIENSPALQLEQQRIGREVTVLTGVFTTLKQQLETTKIEEVKESNYVIVLDPPEIPITNSKPKKKRMVIVAGIFGLGLGMLLAFLREFFQKIINDENEMFQKIVEIMKKNINDILFFSKSKK